MPSDVNYSLANALSDFASARRAEPKAAEGAASPAGEDQQARKASFGHLMREDQAKSRPVAEPRSRGNDERNERPNRGQIRKADRPDHPARPEAAGRDRRAADDKAEAAERCAPTADDAKPTEQPGAKDVRACERPGEKEHTDAASAEGSTKPAETAPDGVTVVQAADPTSASPDAAADMLALLEGMIDPGVADGSQAADAAQTTDAAAQPATVVAGGVVTTDPGKTTTSETPDGSGPIGALSAASAGKSGPAVSVPDMGNEAEKTGVGAGLSASDEPIDLALMKTEAKATANSEANAGKTAGEAGAGEAQKADKATAAKTAAPNLHPTRAAHFADFLEGFGGSNAIHRPADILAGLDRPVAASALNRAPETLRPTPLQMLPIEIGMQAVRGVTNFQIRLDPAELGRVDVKLQIRENGEVNASLVVDRVETLQMLRRDASTLQNAFEQAGLKQSPDGLSFSLRGEGREGQQQEQRAQGGAAVDALDEVALQAQIGDAVMRRVHIPNSSIDRMV